MKLRFLLLTIVVCLVGCGRSDNRFLGKWTFDRVYTVAHLPKEAQPATEKASPGKQNANPISGMMDGLKPMLAEELVAQMGGQTFTITPKLVTDSSGNSHTYQVIERATANDLSIKLSDGNIWTLTIDDGRIIMPTTGSVHFKLYFSRADS